MLVLDVHKIEIQNALEKLSLNIKLDFISIPSDEFGTAESLRFIRDKLNRDVLVVPCDIVTDVIFFLLYCIYTYIYILTCTQYG